MAADHIVLELDPEGGDGCLLLPSDARDLVDVVTRLARVLHERDPDRAFGGPLVEETMTGGFVWFLAGAELEVGPAPDRRHLRLASPTPELSLDVQVAVELLQILERYL